MTCMFVLAVFSGTFLLAAGWRDSMKDLYAGFIVVMSQNFCMGI